MLVASDGVRGSFAFPPGEDADVLLPPLRSSPSELLGPELEHLRTALRLEGVLTAPEVTLAKKYGRQQLSCGTIAGSTMTASGIERRNSLPQTNCENLVCCPSGFVERAPVPTCSPTLHYAVVYIDHPQASSYLDCVTSSVDRLGRGRPERRRRMDCF